MERQKKSRHGQQHSGGLDGRRQRLCSESGSTRAAQGDDLLFGLGTQPVLSVEGRTKEEKAKVQQSNRRNERQREKCQRRMEELLLDKNQDLAEMLGPHAMELGGVHQRRRDGQRHRGGSATGDEADQQPRGTLVLPAWRSAHLERILRQLDRRRHDRLRKTPSRRLRHPGFAMLPPPGQEPPSLPSTAYRWMVSSTFAHLYPEAVRTVRANLETHEIEGPLTWGAPAPFELRFARAGASVDDGAADFAAKETRLSRLHVHQPKERSKEARRCHTGLRRSWVAVMAVGWARWTQKCCESRQHSSTMPEEERRRPRRNLEVVGGGDGDGGEER